MLAEALTTAMSGGRAARLKGVDVGERPATAPAAEARDRAPERPPFRGEVAVLVDELRAEIRAILTLMETDDTL